jgi:hypothetical protein
VVFIRGQSINIGYIITKHLRKHDSDAEVI